jgi:4-hydroxy-2-oxoheptanedioate aldolase
MNKNLLKSKVSQNKCVFGPWCMLPSSAVIDVISRSGVDFVIIDMEHGCMDWQVAEEMVRAAYVNQCQPIIRTDNKNANTILHALETGANAVMVPNVAEAKTAKAIALAARYAPKGMRGVSPYTRCHDFTHQNFKESLAKNNQELFLGVLVEGIKGLKNLRKICSVPGIDLVYIGIYDLSQSVGKTGQLDHPKVQKAVSQCLKIIKKSNKIPGTFAHSIQAAKMYRELGFKFVAYVADCYGLKTFYEDAQKKFLK